MIRHESAPAATIPIALPLVEVTIASDGHITVMVDGEPHMPRTPLTRANLQDQVTALATAYATPVRVQVTEMDGATFTDVVLPEDAAQAPRPAPAPRPAAENNPPESTDAGADGESFRVSEPDGLVIGLTGSGFLPGEHVAFAAIVVRRQADDDGTVVLRLPASLTSRRPGPFVLFGQTSGTLVLADPFGGDQR